MRIAFTVPTLPVAQPRAKATAINGKARMYEAKKEHPIHTFKATIRLAAAQLHAGEPEKGALGARLTFVFPMKKKARIHKATKPDVDNLAKGVLDTLNGLLYVDDGQVADLTIRKWHAGADEQPHVEICVWTL